MPKPPFYVLLQHAPLPAATNCSSSAPASFSHPLIEYHFVDDPPSALIPSSAAESVVILDYDDPDSTPPVQALHANFAIAGLNVTDAPGAATTATRDGELRRNDKMYIIQTIASKGDSGAAESLYELDNPQIILAQFKERNALLRTVLDHPIVKPSNSASEVLPRQS